MTQDNNEMRAEFEHFQQAITLLKNFIEQEKLDYKTEARAKAWQKKYAGYTYKPAQFEITIKNEVYYD